MNEPNSQGQIPGGGTPPVVPATTIVAPVQTAPVLEKQTVIEVVHDNIKKDFAGLKHVKNPNATVTPQTPTVPNVVVPPVALVSNAPVAGSPVAPVAPVAPAVADSPQALQERIKQLEGLLTTFVSGSNVPAVNQNPNLNQNTNQPVTIGSTFQQPSNVSVPEIPGFSDLSDNELSDVFQDAKAFNNHLDNTMKKSIEYIDQLIQSRVQSLIPVVTNVASNAAIITNKTSELLSRSKELLPYTQMLGTSINNIMGMNPSMDLDTALKLAANYVRSVTGVQPTPDVQVPRQVSGMPMAAVAPMVPGMPPVQPAPMYQQTVPQPVAQPVQYGVPRVPQPMVLQQPVIPNFAPGSPGNTLPVAPVTNTTVLEGRKISSAELMNQLRLAGGLV